MNTTFPFFIYRSNSLLIYLICSVVFSYSLQHLHNGCDIYFKVIKVRISCLCLFPTHISKKMLYFLNLMSSICCINKSYDILGFYHFSHHFLKLIMEIKLVSFEEHHKYRLFCYTHRRCL